MFRRPLPLNDLPNIPFLFLEEDPNLPPFPFIHRNELIGCLNAAHATDLKTRCSITGLIVLFCFAAIAWKSRIQAVVATSSTEAEFCSSVTCGKIAKCLLILLSWTPFPTPPMRVALFAFAPSPIAAYPCYSVRDVLIPHLVCAVSAGNDKNT